VVRIGHSLVVAGVFHEHARTGENHLMDRCLLFAAGTAR
jgi:hypothetical protein